MLYKNKLVWLLSFLLFIIDLLYPVIITYDTGHYFSYVPILQGDTAFENWDPVRGVVFPAYLLLVKVIFGNGSNGLLICMSLIHVLNFWMILGLILRADKFWQKLIGKDLFIVLIWLFIALDPLILGYSHAVLTEHLSLFFVLLACWICYFLYHAAITKARVDLRFYLILSLITVLAYHLKQPYVGAAIFPMVIVSLFLLFLVPARQKIKILAGMLIVAIFLGASIGIWESVLPKQGIAANQERHINNYIKEAISKNIQLLKTSKTKFVSNTLSNYLALANIYGYDQINRAIEKEVSLQRAAENGVIGYLIFQYYSPNTILPSNYPYIQYVEQYATINLPPKHLNDLFLTMIPKSNFLFSLLYLIAPVEVICLLIIMHKRKSQDWFFILSLIIGTAFLNAILHTFMLIPIDRYLFYGYPLLLASVLIIPNAFSKQADFSPVLEKSGKEISMI